MGKKQLREFLKSRLWDRSKAISNTVTKIGAQFFCMKTGECNKKHYKFQSTKLLLFSLNHLLSDNQIKEGDLKLFFSHENQVYHPYLSEYGSLVSAKRKSAIIRFILQEDFADQNEGPNIRAKIFRGATIIKILVPRVFNI